MLTLFVHGMFWVGVYTTAKKFVIPKLEKMTNKRK